MQTLTQYPATLATLSPHFEFSQTHAVIAACNGAVYRLAGGSTGQCQTVADRMRATYGDAAGFGVCAVADNQDVTATGGMGEFLAAIGAEFVEVQIPFMGFYNSWHDDAIDRAFHDMFQDGSGCAYHGALAYSHAHADTQFGDAFRAYARDYADSYATEYGLDSAQFVTMESPRFYNFETDRLFVRMTRQEVARMFRDTDSDILTRIAGERHTSRSGFISSYSPDVSEWGDVAEWDHNQLATLLLAYVETQTGDKWNAESELGLMESASGNGCIEGWIYEAMGDKARRAVKLASYLRDRAERGETLAESGFDSPL